MSFLRHEQIYQSDVLFVCAQGEAFTGFAPKRLIVLMSLRPAIPWRVALQQSLPPLYRPESMLNRPAETVNHHLPGAGEFSTGDLGNFQPALTGGPGRDCRARKKAQARLRRTWARFTAESTELF
jgi:hypothetical protein